MEQTKTAEQVLQEHYGKHGQCTIQQAKFVRWEDAINAMEAYADQFRTEANTTTLKWVKASDRLPELPNPLPPDTEDERGVLFVNRTHSAAFFWYPSYGQESYGFCFTTEDGLWTLDQWEWLEEVEATPLPNPLPSETDKPLTQCMMGRDGECNHPKCPVSDEDERNGRYCPLPLYDYRQ